MGLTDAQDAYGHAVYDRLHDRGGIEIVERDDGYFDSSEGPSQYLAEYGDWPPHERKAMRLAHGRVLDVGCGGGRVALYLQGQGHEVVAIDNSPLAVATCRLRGVKDARICSVTGAGRDLGVFDTIAMFGNNFGLFGSERRARWLLRRFRSITPAWGRILAETLDPYRTDVPIHLAYHRRNRERGRMAGQIRLRIRYQAYVTPWFDYLFVSREELEALLDGTGWRLGRTIDSDGSQYIAVIERE